MLCQSWIDPSRWGDSCTVAPGVAVQLPPQHQSLAHHRMTDRELVRRPLAEVPGTSRHVAPAVNARGDLIPRRIDRDARGRRNRLAVSRRSHRHLRSMDDWAGAGGSCLTLDRGGRGEASWIAPGCPAEWAGLARRTTQQDDQGRCGDPANGERMSHRNAPSRLILEGGSKSTIHR